MNKEYDEAANILQVQLQNDRAADILAENSHLTYDLLSQDIYDYLDASLMVTANPIEDVKKIETISNNHLKNLRRLINAVAEANSTGNEQLISIANTQRFLKLLPDFCQREQ